MHYYWIRILSRSAFRGCARALASKLRFVEDRKQSVVALGPDSIRKRMAYLLRRPLLQSLPTLPRTIAAVPSALLAKSFLVSPVNSSLRLPSLSHAFSSLTLSTPPRRNHPVVAASPERGAGSILGGIRTIYLPKGARKVKSVLSRGRKKTARAQGKRKVRRFVVDSVAILGRPFRRRQDSLRTIADWDCVRQAKRRRLRMNQIN